MGALDEVLGESAEIEEIRDQVRRLLRSGSGATRRLPPILILGETGTGKGLLAGVIHRTSARAAGAFVDVNCAAIPETLLESELFGFERGAFTDARQAKPGLFQAANGGTIFLDEVGLLPLSLQSKLLKVIEERSVRRLGTTRSEPLDVCVIAATSEDLPAAVQARRFRADLYHRLAVVTLALPPLRDRGRDVLVLAEQVLAHACDEYGLPAKVLGEDAKAALLAYPWPGNVRELANVLERSALLADEPRITAAVLRLPPATRGAPTGSGAAAASVAPAAGGAEATGTERERVEVLEALRATGWNLTHAAAQLGIPRNTLRYRIDRLGLAREGPPARRRGGRPPTRRPSPARPAVASGSPGPSAEPVPEVRRVTLLAVRLLPATLEPVAWEASRALEASAEKVRSFGGRIEEHRATELLAAFGVAPEEDAPRRAAHAAIAVQALGARGRSGAPIPADVRVALHTQPLTVTRAAGTLTLDGDAVDKARRALDALLQAAEPGTVVASAAATRFLASRFELAPLERDAGGACRLLWHAAPGRTRFVGRERELALLVERFELARAGQGQVVLIVGEPGIGKSRLLHELRRRLGRSATWVEGQAVSFGRAMPFHPVIEMLRRVTGIEDGDPEPAAAEKLEKGLRRIHADVAATLPFLRYLLSVGPFDAAILAMDAKARHAAIVRATHSLLERGAELRPHVVVLEDLHWCDPATEDWITRLADLIVTKRVLIVLTCRPGYRLPFGDRSYHTGLALSTLSSADMLRIATGLLGADDLPPALQSLVVEKAEGNPFFAEELIRSLDEVGAIRREGERVVMTAAAARVTVPDTVHEVLLARIDRLDEDVKPVLEIASVIGKTVPFPLLREVSGLPEAALLAALRHLQSAELLHETRVFPEIELTFKHALTQEVAYGSLEPERRHGLHARIVAAIETLHAGRVGEHVERLAYHAQRGGLWAAAARYQLDAGAKAFDHSANREALVWFEQALVALEHLPESQETLEAGIDVRLRMRSTLLQLGEVRRIPEYLRQAETLARVLGDPRRLGWVWTYLTVCSLFAGDPRDALARGERALALAEEVGDAGLRATARTPLAHACQELGDHRRAVELLGETIRTMTGDRVRERLGQAMPPALYARNLSAISLAELGDFEAAARLGRESASLAQALDFPFGLVLARIALGHTYLVEGRLGDADAILDEALRLIDARGFPTWFPWAAAERGYALARSGRTAEGLALLAQALDRALALPLLSGHSQWVAWNAHAHLLAGDVEAAAGMGAEALALSRQRGERGYEAAALHTLGEIAAWQGEAARAEAYLREALALAASLGMRPLAARCRLALAAAGDWYPSPRA
jgi:DNA-binding NtrC family response regulator/tetratricopeptide (TPR) repeat protein